MFKRLKFFPRFGNNNIVMFYFISFLDLFKLVIFPRDVTLILVILGQVDTCCV